MNCHTYQHFHMFLFRTINGRIFSTLINTRVTSLYFRHIDFDTTCSLVDKSFLLCTYTTKPVQNHHKTPKQPHIPPSERNFRRPDGDPGNIQGDSGKNTEISAKLGDFGNSRYPV